MDEEVTTTDILPVEEPAPVETEAPAEAPAEEPAEMPEDNTAELEELRDYKARNEAANAELLKLMKLNPGLTRTIRMMKEGASWEEAVARNIDVSALPVEGDPDYDKWSAAAKAREDEYNKNMEFEQTLAQNRDVSMQNLKDFAAENGMSEEQAMQFIEAHVSPILDQIAQLNFSKEFLTMIHKAVNHESKIAEAKEEGMIAGRNEQIEEKMMTPPPGDGLPKGASEGAAAPKPKKPQSYIDYLKS